MKCKCAGVNIQGSSNMRFGGTLLIFIKPISSSVSSSYTSRSCAPMPQSDTTSDPNVGQWPNAALLHVYPSTMMRHAREVTGTLAPGNLYAYFRIASLYAQSKSTHPRQRDRLTSVEPPIYSRRKNVTRGTAKKLT